MLKAYNDDLSQIECREHVCINHNPQQNDHTITVISPKELIIPSKSSLFIQIIILPNFQGWEISVFFLVYPQNLHRNYKITHFKTSKVKKSQLNLITFDNTKRV